MIAPPAGLRCNHQVLFFWTKKDPRTQKASIDSVTKIDSTSVIGKVRAIAAQIATATAPTTIWPPTALP
jgi:hypothetical protein